MGEGGAPLPNPDGLPTDPMDRRPPEIIGEALPVPAQVEAIYKEPTTITAGQVQVMNSMPMPVAGHQQTPEDTAINSTLDLMSDLGTKIPPLFSAPAAAETPAPPTLAPEPQVPPSSTLDKRIIGNEEVGEQINAARPDQLTNFNQLRDGYNAQNRQSTEDARPASDEQHPPTAGQDPAAAHPDVSDSTFGQEVQAAAERVVDPRGMSGTELYDHALTDSDAVKNLGSAVDAATTRTPPTDNSKHVENILRAQAQQERNEAGQGITSADAERAMQGLPIEPPPLGEQPPQPGQQPGEQQ